MRFAETTEKIPKKVKVFAIIDPDDKKVDDDVEEKGSTTGDTAVEQVGDSVTHCVIQALLDSAMHDLFVKMQNPDHCLYQFLTTP